MPILYTKEELLNDSYMQKIDVGRIGMCSVKYSGITKGKLEFDRETRDSYVRRVVSQAINDNIQTFEGQLATRDFYMGIDLNRDDSKFSGIKWIEQEDKLTLSVRIDRYTADIDRKVILIYAFTVLNGPLPDTFRIERCYDPKQGRDYKTGKIDNALEKDFDVYMFNPLIFLMKNSEVQLYFDFPKNYQKYYTLGEKPKLKLYGIVCEALGVHING